MKPGAAARFPNSRHAELTEPEAHGARALFRGECEQHVRFEGGPGQLLPQAWLASQVQRLGQRESLPDDLRIGHPQAPV